MMKNCKSQSLKNEDYFNYNETSKMVLHNLFMLRKYIYREIKFFYCRLWTYMFTENIIIIE